MHVDAAPAAGCVPDPGGGARTVARGRVHGGAGRLWRITLAACLAAGAVACSPRPPGIEGTDGIVVEDAWMRATPPGTPVAGGYLTLRNAGGTPDRLLSVHSPAARKVEIHEVRHEGGVARMRPLANGLVIAPGSSVPLQPGGAHLMFLDPARRFVEGETVPVTLRFERAAPVQVTLPVRALGAAGPSEHAGH